MSELPAIFSDLALILVTAGVTTVLFKWLKQPLVLGYIIAGLLIGPYFPWFPVINDHESVEIWSEIGMVFLLFAIGLEFSFKKLKKQAGTVGITFDVHHRLFPRQTDGLVADGQYLPRCHAFHVIHNHYCQGFRRLEDERGKVHQQRHRCIGG